MFRQIMLCAILVLVVAGVLMALDTEAQSNGPIHAIILVSARNYEYIDVYASAGSTIEIVAYIFRSGSWEPLDIDIQILRPDGSIELAKQRYSEMFQYTFTVTMTGTYRILLDNTFSILTSKIVDISVFVSHPPETVTITHTNIVTETQTQTETITETTTHTQKETITQTALETEIGLPALTAAVALIVGLLIGRKAR